MASQSDLAVAFALTAAAGLSTSLGAALVFVPSFNNDVCLGIALAFAAGVMLYVSFIEIFVKSLDSYVAYFDEKDGVDTATVVVDDYAPAGAAYHCTTASFFLGILITWLLDQLIHALKGEHAHGPEGASTQPPAAAKAAAEPGGPASAPAAGAGAINSASSAEPVLDAMRVGVGRLVEGMTRSSSYHELMSQNGTALLAEDPSGGDGKAEDGGESGAGTAATASADQSKDAPAGNADEKSAKELLKMALITGVAVALHNFPEGFATFIATVQDKNAGAAIAIAIGVHNIPEGICVASPIYFATGNKWKAFMWGTLSGIAEPIAGAIGWIILSQRDTDLSHLAYAMLFGVVTGMMAYIAFSELIPTALRYDPDRKYFMGALTGGMVVMAASLMLFVSA